MIPCPSYSRFLSYISLFPINQYLLVLQYPSQNYLKKTSLSPLYLCDPSYPSVAFRMWLFLTVCHNKLHFLKINVLSLKSLETGILFNFLLNPNTRNIDSQNKLSTNSHQNEYLKIAAEPASYMAGVQF